VVNMSIRTDKVSPVLLHLRPAGRRPKTDLIANF
jgi:hypothetical protein